MNNLGPQTQGIKATRIGNKNGLDAKEKPKPKPREICPRFPASIKTYTHNGVRNRNSGMGLGLDKTNVTPTKKLATPPTNRSNVSRTSHTATNATPSNRSYSARIRPQTAKSNAKPTAV